MALQHYGGKIAAASMVTATKLTTALGLTQPRALRLLQLHAPTTNTGAVWIGPDATVTAAGNTATGFVASGDVETLDFTIAYSNTDNFYLISANGSEVLYAMCFE